MTTIVHGPIVASLLQSCPNGLIISRFNVATVSEEVTDHGGTLKLIPAMHGTALVKGSQLHASPGVQTLHCILMQD